MEYCWSHHTKYVVTVIKTLIAPLHTKEAKSLRWPVPVSSVQCRAVAAEQNLINLPSAETEPIFHFHSSPHFCSRHGHGTHNPHHRPPAIQYVRKSNWIQQFLRNFSSKSFGSVHCPCTGVAAACGGCTEGVGRVFCITISPLQSPQRPHL